MLVLLANRRQRPHRAVTDFVCIGSRVGKADNDVERLGALVGAADGSETGMLTKYLQKKNVKKKIGKKVRSKIVSSTEL